MARRIEIYFTETETGAYRVMADVNTIGLDWSWLLRELKKLSDAKILALFVEDDGDQAVGPEGIWGLLELDPYLLIAQLKNPDRLKARYSVDVRYLKISRLYKRRDAAEAIEELRRLENETARRLRKARQTQRPRKPR